MTEKTEQNVDHHIVLFKKVARKYLYMVNIGVVFLHPWCKPVDKEPIATENCLHTQILGFSLSLIRACFSGYV